MLSPAFTMLRSIRNHTIITPKEWKITFVLYALHNLNLIGGRKGNAGAIRQKDCCYCRINRRRRCGQNGIGRSGGHNASRRLFVTGGNTGAGVAAGKECAQVRHQCGRPRRNGCAGDTLRPHIGRWRQRGAGLRRPFPGGGSCCADSPHRGLPGAADKGEMRPTDRSLTPGR